MGGKRERHVILALTTIDCQKQTSTTLYTPTTSQNSGVGGDLLGSVSPPGAWPQS